MGRARQKPNLIPVGEALHISKSGRLIVRLSRYVKERSFLLDEKGGVIGQLLEVMGPVNSPYGYVAISGEKGGKVVGKRVYVSEAALQGASSHL
jgi:rRNA processing protein Gar1